MYMLDSYAPLRGSEDIKIDPQILEGALPPALLFPIFCGANHFYACVADIQGKLIYNLNTMISSRSDDDDEKLPDEVNSFTKKIDRQIYGVERKWRCYNVFE